MLIHNQGGKFDTPKINNSRSLSGLKRPSKKHQVIPTYHNLTSPENLKWKQARTQVLGAAWKLLEVTINDQPKQFELRSTWWKIDPEGVECICQKAMMGYLAQDIDELGGNSVSGYLMTCLNTEYNHDAERFEWFVRGIACGEMLNVVDSLRHKERLWSYEGQRPGVLINDAPVTDIASTVQWLFEPHYSQIYYGAVGNDGRRLGQNANPPSYLYKDLLAFCKADDIDDICILRNLRVSNDCKGLEVIR